MENLTTSISKVMEYLTTSISEVSSILKKNVPVIVYTYIMWTIVHFTAAHLYVQWCTGHTIIGLIVSPLFAASPQCQALSWTMYTISQKFVQLWLLVGTYLCTKMMLNKD